MFEKTQGGKRNSEKLSKERELISSVAKPTFDIKGRYKWDAWTEVKGNVFKKEKYTMISRVFFPVLNDFHLLGLSKEEAEEKYIALVEELKAKQ